MRQLPGDTIAAISTALGPGAVALVRLSGERALEIADRVFRGLRPLSRCPTHTVHHGRIVDEEDHVIDEVLATVMLAPHTYTTEHMIEFGCHGGPVPARQVLAACLAAGARQARRGEFTERAFHGGRIDLVQAEAVADIVAAGTPRGLEMALGQLEGGLSDRVGELREALLRMRAEVEAAIDFPEDVEIAAPTGLFAPECERARAAIDELLEGCEMGAAVRDGVSVAIVGKPNVGKSSLLNALLMRDRAIVTKAPGTTRDAIEESLHVDGIAVRLVDTAGWREADDEAERAGVERARSAARGADLVLFVVDGSAPPDGGDRTIAAELDPLRTVVVANKQDLGRAVDTASLVRLLQSGEKSAGVRSGEAAHGAADDPEAVGRSGRPRALWASALTGEGISRLRASLADDVLGAHCAECVSVSNVRHIDALRRVRSALERARTLAESCAPNELTASELADAAMALGEITGETTPEDVLRHIFDRFCIGK